MAESAVFGVLDAQVSIFSIYYGKYETIIRYEDNYLQRQHHRILAYLDCLAKALSDPLFRTHCRLGMPKILDIQPSPRSRPPAGPRLLGTTTASW